MEDQMEPVHHPYVDPETEPGDAGVEEWVEGKSAPADHPHAHEAHKVDAEGAPEGSPADLLIHHPEVIHDRTDGRGA
jgi:hypothetical protein